MSSSPPIIGRMELRRLEPGDELRCPHCRRWHPLSQRQTEGTATGADMLYFKCRGLAYFGGFIGQDGGRHETRRDKRCSVMASIGYSESEPDPAPVTNQTSPSKRRTSRQR